MILEEFDDTKRAVINPDQIIDRVSNMPEIAVACFSKDLFLKIVAGAKCVEIAELLSANGKKTIYELTYKNVRMALFMIGVSASFAATEVEEVHAMGVSKFVVFGNCGVLDNTIEDCGIIIPTRAIRDEGTSYHYLKPDRTIEVNKKYKDLFKEILADFKYDYKEGTTWTTDAFYRETRKKVAQRKQEGAICVEMECSALQAVADFRNLDFFTFFYAGDSLESPVWDERSLNGEVKLDEKSQIAVLALELAYKIMSK